MPCEIINSNTFDRYIKTGNVTIIDLRNDDDYKKKHIKGAVCIDADVLDSITEQHMMKRERDLKAGGVVLKKNKIVLLYCSRGAQSYFICRKLSMLGFNVKSLAGGIERYSGVYITA